MNVESIPGVVCIFYVPQVNRWKRGGEKSKDHSNGFEGLAMAAHTEDLTGEWAPTS